MLFKKEKKEEEEPIKNTGKMVTTIPADEMPGTNRQGRRAEASRRRKQPMTDRKDTQDRVRFFNNVQKREAIRKKHAAAHRKAVLRRKKAKALEEGVGQVHFTRRQSRHKK